MIFVFKMMIFALKMINSAFKGGTVNGSGGFCYGFAEMEPVNKFAFGIKIDEFC